jgi:hypothetical protein
MTGEWKQVFKGATIGLAMGMLWLLFATICKADDLVLSFGPTLNGNTNPKMAGIGYEFILGDEVSLMPECRGIFNSPLNGACALVLSARVETASGLFMRLGAGPAWVFRTDDRVSSNFNFNLQGVIGIAAKGWYLGAGYWHYSNAGLPIAYPNPNLGRDFFGPVVAIHL